MFLMIKIYLNLRFDLPCITIARQKNLQKNFFNVFQVCIKKTLETSHAFQFANWYWFEKKKKSITKQRLFYNPICGLITNPWHGYTRYMRADLLRYV